MTHKYETLKILIEKLLVAKYGASGSAAVALGLVQMVSGCPLIDDFLVVGQVDLRGRLLQVGGLAAKARAAMSSSLTTMVIPSDGAEEAIAEEEKSGTQGEEESRPPPRPLLLRESRTAVDMLDVLEIVVPGELTVVQTYTALYTAPSAYSYLPPSLLGLTNGC